MSVGCRRNIISLSCGIHCPLLVYFDRDNIVEKIDRYDTTTFEVQKLNLVVHYRKAKFEILILISWPRYWQWRFMFYNTSVRAQIFKTWFSCVLKGLFYSSSYYFFLNHNPCVVAGVRTGPLRSLLVVHVGPYGEKARRCSLVVRDDSKGTNTSHPYPLP